MAVFTDSETGLVLLSLRFYDNVTGRFLTRDPLGYAGGRDLYAYCRNNPVGLADPSGLCPNVSENTGGADDLPERMYKQREKPAPLGAGFFL